MEECKGFYSRGKLPHLDVPEGTQFLTWRLHDSIPPGEWDRILRATEHLPERERRSKRARLADDLLDQGAGEAVLRHAWVASIVQESLWHGHGRRYVLHAYVVMPNHVHLVATLLPDQRLETVTRTIKSFTAHEVNKALGRTGRLWQIESFDRLIRDEEHFRKTVAYVEWNPVKAKLAVDPSGFSFSSAFPANSVRLRAL